MNYLDGFHNKVVENIKAQQKKIEADFNKADIMKGIEATKKGNLSLYSPPEKNTIGVHNDIYNPGMKFDAGKATLYGLGSSKNAHDLYWDKNGHTVYP